MLRLFGGKDKTIKKWRSRAWTIDPKKTKLTIINTANANGHVPPWIYKRYFLS